MMKIPSSHPIWVVVLFSSALLAVVHAAALPCTGQSIVLNSTSMLDPTFNGTFLGAIDPRIFRSRTLYGPQALPATSVLINALNAMTQLALQDYESDIGLQVYNMDDPRYSQVEIIIRPWADRSDATLKVGYAVLGLFEIVLNILSDPKNRFKASQSQFLYDGRPVGYLLMRMIPGSPAISNPTSTANANDTSTALTAPAWADPHLTLQVTQGSPDILSIYEVFFTCISVLRVLATHTTSQKVREISLTIDSPPITKAGQPMIVSFQNIGRTERNPPFFKWEWAIKGIASLPAYMLQERNFRGVTEMVIQVDRIDVGLAYAARTQPGSAVQ